MRRADRAEVGREPRRHADRIQARLGRQKRAAPFKRNDAMLDTLPIGVVVFPVTGITDNLADKARKLGIPLLDLPTSGA